MGNTSEYKEHVRSTVWLAVRELAGMGPYPPPAELCDAIAKRVADELVKSSVTTTGAVLVTKDFLLRGMGASMHGPNGRGERGDCSKNCFKCEVQELFKPFLKKIKGP